MRILSILTAVTLLKSVNAAAWGHVQRGAAEEVNGPKLEVRATVSTCAQPTTTFTKIRYSTTCAQPTTTISVSRTVLTTATVSKTVTSTIRTTSTRTVRTTTTATTTATRYATITQTATRTVRTTSTFSITRTSTSVVTSTRTRKTTITLTATATTCAATTTSSAATSSTTDSDATTTTNSTTADSTTTSDVTSTTASSTSADSTSAASATTSSTAAPSCIDVGDTVQAPNGGYFQNFYSGSAASIPRTVYDTDYADHPPRATWYDPATWSVCAAMSDCASVTQSNAYNTIQFYMDASSGQWTCLLSWALLQDPSLFVPDSTRQQSYGYYYVPNPASSNTSTTSTSMSTSSVTTISTSTTDGTSTLASTTSTSDAGTSTVDPTTTSDVTTMLPTTSAAATTTTPVSLPLCSPVQDPSFEQATQSQLDGGDGSGNLQMAGAWYTQGGSAGVTNNGPTYANDGTQNAVLGETGSAGTSTIYQDLSNLNGVYTLSYYYAVFVVYAGSPCTFQVQLGNDVVDSFQVTAAMAADLNNPTIPYTQRTIAQPQALSGTVRLSFDVVCTDPSTYSNTFVDTVQMSIQNANPGVNCVTSADQSTAAPAVTTTIDATSTTDASTLTTTTSTTTDVPTTTSTTTTLTTTTSTTTTLAAPTAALLCNPVVDGSFEDATQDELDGGTNFGVGPYQVGGWTSLDNTVAFVSANGPQWAQDGQQEALYFASANGAPQTGTLYQDLTNLNGIYSLSYWSGVFDNAQSVCTFQVTLGNSVIDSWTIPQNMYPDSDGNPIYEQRTANTPYLTGTQRLSLVLTCTGGELGFLVDSVAMQLDPSPGGPVCS